MDMSKGKSLDFGFTSGGQGGGSFDPAGIYPALTAGDITPKTNAPIASTIKMAMTTTGGDMDIKNGVARIKSIRGNLVNVGGILKPFTFKKFVSTGMNLVDPNKYFTTTDIRQGITKRHYYFPVQRGAWGSEGTTQENNGYIVVFAAETEVKYSEVKPRENMELEDVEYHTDSKGVKHYLPDSDGWFVVITTNTESVPACHITWSGAHDTEAGEFDNSVIELLVEEELRGIIGTNRSVFDEINFDNGKFYRRTSNGNLASLQWTMTTEASGEGEEEVTTYIFTAPISAMKVDGLYISELEGLTVAGGNAEYRSTEITSVEDFVAFVGSKKVCYELESAIEIAFSLGGDFTANDYGLTYFLDADGELASVAAYVDFEFQQGGKDQLYNAVTYQKTLAEVIATALCEINERLKALEGVRDTVECTNLIVNRSALIANGMTAVATAPASATSKGNTGDFFVNTTHFYICVAPNTWRRVAISTF